MDPRNTTRASRWSSTAATIAPSTTTAAAAIAVTRRRIDPPDRWLRYRSILQRAPAEGGTEDLATASNPKGVRRIAVTCAEVSVPPPSRRWST